MKSCTEVEVYLDDYVDNALSGDVLKAVETHLAECADCRAQVEALRDLLGQVHELPDCSPDLLRDGLRGAGSPVLYRV